MEAGKFGAGKLEAGKLGAGKLQAGKLEVGKLEVCRLQAGKLEVHKMEAWKVEACKFEAGKLEAGKLKAHKMEDHTMEVCKTAHRRVPFRMSALVGILFALESRKIYLHRNRRMRFHQGVYSRLEAGADILEKAYCHQEQEFRQVVV